MYKGKAKCMEELFDIQLGMLKDEVETLGKGSDGAVYVEVSPMHANSPL